MLSFKTLLITGTLLSAGTPLFAADYYISTAGSDSNPGTLDRPWKSLQKANAALTAGDTVHVRAGEYREVIKPQRSGAPGQYITYKAYNGETPTLTGSPGGTAIVLDNRDYVNVDGFRVDGKAAYTSANLTHWASLNGASYNVIQNCGFKFAKGWEGVILDGGAHHNRVLNNRMDHLGTYSDPGNSKNPDRGDMISVENAKFNLIQGNHLTRGGHNLLLCAGSYNVIRNNVFDNSWGDGVGNRNLSLKARKGSDGYNLFEGNIIKNASKAKDNPRPPAMKGDGTNQIIRRNFIINNIHEVMSGAVRYDVPYTRKAKIYNNVIYNNGGPAWRLQFYSSGTSVHDNMFKNNICYRNRQRPENDKYDTEIYLNIQEAGTPLAGNQAISNAFYKAAPSDAMVYVQGIGRKTLAWFEENHRQNFAGNLQVAPGFIVDEPTTPAEFELRGDSPLIDKGAFLTQTRSAGSGTQIPVADAGYFTNGFGVIPGDLIQVGINAPVRITDVDYQANIVTVAQPVLWNQADPVSEPYTGTAPDIGAYEFASALKAPPPPINLQLEMFTE